ncbi:MAG: translocation/assembly module TamB domain-containing protein, partial [Parvibaculum sp.]|nr:translocation/assembly module TamB domain-containing protein [Parvibaculum sp.]
MTERETYRATMGLIPRIGRGLLGLGFALAGLALAAIVLAVAVLNIPAARHGLLHYALATVNTGETQIRIGDIGGKWPGQLRLRDLEIADADGTWLTLANADLDWRPLALWRGEVHVTLFEVAGLEVVRVPGGEDSAENEGFSLPVLPFDIRIDTFGIKETRLGRDVIGEEVLFDASGSAQATRRVTQLELNAMRRDDVPGEAAVSLLYWGGPERGRLRAQVTDGGAGKPGIAARLFGGGDFERLTLTATGESLAGLMTGEVKAEAGDFVQADVEAHGAIGERINLTFNAEASGRLVARELEPIGAPRRIAIAGKLTETERDVFLLDALNVEAGELHLTGAATARQLAAGPYSIEAEGSLTGLGRMLDLEEADLLETVGWRIKGDADDALTAARIEEAAVTTGAGVARFRGILDFGDVFAMSGDGEAEITDLAPLGEMLGQPMRGTAQVSLSDFTLEGDAGRGDIALETSAIATDDPALDRLLAQGMAGTAAFRLEEDGAIALPGISIKAGEGFSLDGNFALSAEEVATGEATLQVAEIGALLPDADATGTLTATARIDGPLRTANAALKAELSGGTLAGFDARRATVEASLANGRGPLAFRLEGRDGRATLDTQVTLPEEGGARLDAIEANVFGAQAAGTVSISPEGLASGHIGGERVALQPLGKLAGIALEGRADIALDLAARAEKQDALLTLTSRRIDVQLADSLTLERVDVRVALADLMGDAVVDARAEAEGGASGNTRFTTLALTAAGPLERLEIAAHLAGERLTLKAEPVRLDIEALYEPDGITVRRFDGAIGGETAALARPFKLEMAEGLIRARALALDFNGAGGPGSLTGALTLRARAAQVTLDIDKLPLELLSPVVPTEVTGGTVSGTVEMDTGREQAEVRLRIADVQLVESGLEERPSFNATADATWAGRRLTLNARALGVSEEPFILRASLPLVRDREGAWPMLPTRGAVDGSLTWNGPLASLMALFDLPGQRLTGDADISLTAEGDISAPLVSGRARIANGTFENFETGTAMRDLDITIRGERSEAMSFTMSARDSDNGRLTGEGTVSLAAGAAPAVDIRTRFANMQVVRRQDLVLAVDGDLTLTGPALPPSLDAPLLLQGVLTTTDA